MPEEVSPRALIIDDDEVFATMLVRSFARRNIHAICAHDAQQALSAVREFRPQWVTLDLNMPEQSGLQLLPQLLDIDNELKIVVLTGYSSIATTVSAIKMGAYNYLCKPAGADEILAAFDDAAFDDGKGRQQVVDKPISVMRLEWEHIQKVLAEQDGNVSATARALGMHRRTLQRKLQKRPVSD